MGKIKIKKKVVKKILKEDKKVAEKETSSDDWFADGDDLDETKFKDVRKRASTFRIFVKKDEERDITFISDKAFTYKEHNVKLNGYFGNYFTCLSKTNRGRCPLCEAKVTNPKAPISNSYVAKAFWVIDHEPYEDKEGNEIVDSVKLLVMKTQSYNPMKKIISKYFADKADWSYKGLRVTLMRSSNAMSPSTGDSFHVVGKNPIPKNKKYNKGREDLIKEMEPMSREDLLAVVDNVLYSNDDDE